MSVLLTIVAILMIGGIVAGLAYLIYQLLSNSQPGSGKISADLRKMRTEMAPWIDDLIPWTKEEMELMSHNQINRVIKKGIAPTAKGIITSIYNEPMMAYSFKKYVSPNANAVLVVRSSHHEFAYRIKNKGVDLMIDQQRVGVIKDGKLYSHSSKRLAARINRPEGELLLPVIIGEREMGMLNLADQTMKANARAFQFLGEMDKGEEAVFLSLAVFELLKAELPDKWMA